MKTTIKFTLTAILIGAATLIPPAPSSAEDAEAAKDAERARLFEAIRKAATKKGATDVLPAPLVPEGSKMTAEMRETIQLINARLVDPIRQHSNRRVRMSRALVRMDTQFHIAITDTSDSLFPFDLYIRHARGSWQKFASGVCHPGMESLKVAIPKTGVMVDPAKHPLFIVALRDWKRLPANKAS